MRFFDLTDETVTSHVIGFARPVRFLSILNSIDNNQNIAWDKETIPLA